MDIRKLKASEIEVMPKIVKENGCMLLLYKDARCDMRILDETFGSNNWQRKHSVINGNLFCQVSIWDEEKEQFIIKEDVGVESHTEKEKGQASDSFKRACFNVGIGRELYTAPFIWVNLNGNETYKQGNSWKLDRKVNFEVAEIGYNDDSISQLKIIDQNGKTRFTMNNGSNKPKNDKKSKESTKQKLLRQLRVKYKNSDTNKNIITEYANKHGELKNLSEDKLQELLSDIRKEES